MIRIIQAVPLEGHHLKLEFSDGFECIYSVEPERRGGLFRRIEDPNVFNAVQINSEFGCVEWPGGIDLCPTSMREEMSR